MRQFFALALLAAFCVPGLAHACSAFKTRLSTQDQKLPVAAKIQVTDTGTDSSTGANVTEALVLLPYRGVEADETILVKADAPNCRPDAQFKIGQTYYVAGAWGDDGYIHPVKKSRR